MHEAEKVVHLVCLITLVLLGIIGRPSVPSRLFIQFSIFNRIYVLSGESKQQVRKDHVMYC